MWLPFVTLDSICNERVCHPYAKYAQWYPACGTAQLYDYHDKINNIKHALHVILKRMKDQYIYIYIYILAYVHTPASRLTSWSVGYPFNRMGLARYVKLRVAHVPGIPGTFFLPPRISDPDMHHGMCLTHMPWCMPGLLTCGFLWNQWRGKRSRHSWRMLNPQFYVSGKRPMIMTLARCAAGWVIMRVRNPQGWWQGVTFSLPTLIILYVVFGFWWQSSVGASHIRVHKRRASE